MPNRRAARMWSGKPTRLRSKSRVSMRRQTGGFKTTHASRSVMRHCVTAWCASARWSFAQACRQRRQRGATRFRPALPRFSTRPCRAIRSRRRSQHGKSAIFRPARSPACACSNDRRPAAQSKILVTLPNGETRQMEAGPSSVITKAVVEVFATRFLGDPAVMWISESGNKIIQRDDELARSLGLKIESRQTFAGYHPRRLRT